MQRKKQMKKKGKLRRRREKIRLLMKTENIFKLSLRLKSKLLNS